MHSIKIYAKIRKNLIFSYFFMSEIQKNISIETQISTKEEIPWLSLEKSSI